MPQPLIFDSRTGPVPVVLHVDAYCDNNRLSISLLTENGYIRAPYCRLTVNLTESPLLINEAYIDSDISGEAIFFIQKYRLGEVLPDTARSGYCTYRKVAFDLERLKELDPAGMERFKSYHHKTYDFMIRNIHDPDDPGTAVHFPKGLDACQEKQLAGLLSDIKIEHPKGTDTEDLISLGLEAFQKETGIAWRYKEIGDILF